MDYLEARRARIEDRLAAEVADLEPPELRDRVDHAALSGGKRVRPTVAILACEALGGDPADAIDYAVGIELVHTASLVIDDIIDESAVRRGEPSAWAAHGYGGAVIASDGLIGEAFRLFSRSSRATERVAAAMVDLGEGEATELVADPSDEAAYMELARKKTGALFRAAAEVGAIAAGGADGTVAGLGRYAERVGIAFQIRDDVLDAIAEPAALGKPTGQDVTLERPSLVRVADLSPEAANRRARTQADLALDALEGVTILDPRAGDYLADLAEFVVTREH